MAAGALRAGGAADGQDAAKDADLDGVAGVGGQAVAGEDGPLVDDCPLLVVVGVGEAGLDEAGLGLVVDPSDRFATQEDHG